VKNNHEWTYPKDRQQARNNASSAIGKAVGQTNTAKRNKRNQNNDMQKKCIITTKTIRKTLDNM
jgi:hypothetical protein